MKYLLIWTILLWGLTTSALAIDFTGEWTGKGYTSSPGAAAALPHHFTLRIVQTSDSLHLLECRQHTVSGSASCMESRYSLDPYQRIFNSRGRKVGDLFPFRIHIFESHTQASEQILIKANPLGDLRYIYNYSNMDGASSFRQADLTPKL